MEKFMLLFRGSEVYDPGQSAQALQQLTSEMMKWVVEISESGAHVSSEKLSREGIQVYESETHLVEHPFGDLSEIIGGITIIQAKNINEAIEIARKCPILNTNASIEVRPILGM